MTGSVSSSAAPALGWRLLRIPAILLLMLSGIGLQAIFTYRWKSSGPDL